MSLFVDIFIVIIAAALPFLSSIQGEFVLDDDRALRDNLDVNWNTPVIELFKNDFWGTPLHTNASHKSWRPITVLSFKLTNWAFGMWTPAYHAGNILFHCIACVTLLCFINNHLSVYIGRTGRLVAAIIFAVHPAHVENVASIVGRADVLCFIFMYLGIHFFVVGRQMMFLFCYVLSIMSKELGILTPILCLGYELVVKYKIIRLLKNKIDNNPFPLLKSTYLIILFAIVVVGSRVIRGHRSSPKMSFVDNPIILDNSASLLTKFYYYLFVHSWYFITLVFPYYSCSDWGFNVFPGKSAETWLAPACSILITYVTVIIIPIVMCIRNTHAESKEFAVICSCLVIVPFLPASGIIPVGTVLAERLLYIPSVGFALVVGKFFENFLLKTETTTAVISKKKKSEITKTTTSVRYSVVGILFLVILLLSFRTWNRSDDWNTPEKLFKSTIESCPASAKAQFSLGVVFMQRDDPKSALPFFENSLKIHPTYAESLVALGRIQRDYKGNVSLSVSYFQRALESEKSNPEAHEHLGISMSMAGQPEQGIKLLERAIRINKNLRLPPSGEVYGNYGTALGMAKRFEDSAAAYAEALSRPGSPSQKCSWRRNYVIILKSIPKVDQRVILLQLQQMINNCKAFIDKPEIAGYIKSASELEAKLRSA